MIFRVLLHFYGTYKIVNNWVTCDCLITTIKDNTTVATVINFLKNENNDQFWSIKAITKPDGIYCCFIDPTIGRKGRRLCWGKVNRGNQYHQNNVSVELAIGLFRIVTFSAIYFCFIYLRRLFRCICVKLGHHITFSYLFHRFTMKLWKPTLKIPGNTWKR